MLQVSKRLGNSGTESEKKFPCLSGRLQETLRSRFSVSTQTIRDSHTDGCKAPTAFFSQSLPKSIRSGGSGILQLAYVEVDSLVGHPVSPCLVFVGYNATICCHRSRLRRPITKPWRARPLNNLRHAVPGESRAATHVQRIARSQSDCQVLRSFTVGTVKANNKDTITANADAYQSLG